MTLPTSTPHARVARHARSASTLATVLWAVAVLGLGAMHPGFSQVDYPVSLLGARGVPGAPVFNVLGFVLPGLLAAVAAFRLRDAVAARGWAARVGSQLLLLSGLAFVAQGLLPLDASDLDATASRLHAVAWSLWWIAALAGTALLATGCRRAALVLAVVLPVVALVAWAGFPALAQRIAVAAWLVLPALAAGRVQP